MTAPDVVDVTARLIAWLPKVLKTEAGHSVNVTWVDELEEDMAGRTGIVYGTVRRMLPEVELIDHHHDKREVFDNEQEDDIAYVSGQDDYFVSQRDIVAISSIMGTLSGVDDHEFVEGVDYEAVAGPAYTTKSSIHWLAGDRPDDGTDFTVAYTHRTIERRGSFRTNATYRLCLHVAKDPVVSNVKYAKTRLGEQVLESLMAQMVKGQGKLLAAGVKVRNIMPLGLISISPGEDRARFFLDVRVQRHLVYTDEVTQAIGKVTPAFTGSTG